MSDTHDTSARSAMGFAALAIAVVLILSLTGCSDAQKIALGANEARRAAHAAKLGTESSAQTIAANIPIVDAGLATAPWSPELDAAMDASAAIAAVVPDLQAAAQDMQRVVDAADSIAEALPGVGDKTPAWMKTTTWVAAAVVFVVVLIVLWRTGIMELIGAAVGLITPRRTKSAAKLLAEGATDEAVAVMREDRRFNAAYSKARKEVPDAPNTR